MGSNEDYFASYSKIPQRFVTLYKWQPCSIYSSPFYLSTMALGNFKRRIDLFYAVYFILHFLNALVTGTFIALPDSYLFGFQRKLAESYITKNSDLLVATKPIWLRTSSWVEVLFQTPFLPIAAYSLYKGSNKIYPALLVHGVKASISTLQCIAEAVFLEPLTPFARFKLALVYLPTLIIPLVITVDSYKIVSSWAPPVSYNKAYVSETKKIH